MSELLELRKLSTELKREVDFLRSMEVDLRTIIRLQDETINQYDEIFKASQINQPQPVRQCKGTLTIAFRQN